MADDNEEQNPVDQLVDLFVYAPVGLLYEYQDVLPKLVKRGKSQVQLARVVGQLAMNRRSADNFTVLAEGLAGVVAKQITEIGSAIGLAPPQDGDSTAESDPTLPPPPTPASVAVEAGEAAAAPSASAEDADEVEDRPLPIARYDELKAKEIIDLLDDLEPHQLDRIRLHEESNRARKTVLGKLERLGR
jgi:hypothetical protein